MKHILVFVALVLMPLWLSAQYRASCFTFNDSENQYFALPCTVVSNNDTVIQLPNPQVCSGLFVSGYVELTDSIDGYARVTVKDENNFEYLVYEIYPILADSSIVYFSKTGLESSVLNQIKPKSLKIETHNASVHIDSIHYIFNNYLSRTFLSRSEQSREAQCEYISQRLDSLLVTKRKMWRAGNTSVSRLTYEEKKDMFGGNVPVLYGFDYYKGGVFVMPNFEKSLTTNRFILEGQFVPEWDWRNRHGRNWLTPVKDQGICGSCWAFAAVGVVETYINLYYNQLFDYDLSEQEIVSCASPDGCSGDSPGVAFNYMKTGIVLENCFPYTGAINNCDNKCHIPSETITLEDYDWHSNFELVIKQLLFKAPTTISINSWNHALVLAGYKDIQLGQNLFGMIELECDSTLEHQTAWLVKNSWGTDWGLSGYAYFLTRPDDIGNIMEAVGSVTSQRLDSSDIIREDADGDGYYFWGLGAKPSNCSTWIPDEEDGDDSDYSKGPIDEFGFLQDIIPDELDSIYITTDTILSTEDFTIHQHIIVCSNATLTIRNHLTCYNGVSLTIMGGGSVVVSNGILDNVILKMQPASKLTLSNNGTITHNKESVFKIPKGAIFLNTNGSIGYN